MILKEPRLNIAKARIRNMALSQLLFDIDQNKLRHPFNERPTKHAYNELRKKLIFLLEGKQIHESLKETEPLLTNNSDCEILNQELVLDEFLGHSICNEERTYTAIKCLPDGSGVFGYVAVTVGDGVAQWLNANGQPIITPEPSPKLLTVHQAKQNNWQTNYSQIDSEMSWLDVLKNRRPPDSRENSIEFYRKMYEAIAQEMVTQDIHNEIFCPNPVVDQLLNYLVDDLKNIRIDDPRVFNRVNLLSLLKTQLKNVINKIENRSETLECAIKSSNLSRIIQLPKKCCYDLVSNAIWNEMSEQRPGTKYMDILVKNYPKEVHSLYLSVLIRQKQLIIKNVIEKYCKILDDMFEDLEKAILSKLYKYKNAKREWLLVHQIINEYVNERFYKNKLHAVDSSIDETTKTFFLVIYNEMEMAQKKLKTMIKKNIEIAEQIPILRIEIGKKEQIQNSMINEYEEQMEKLNKEINNEKRDITVREHTICELLNRK